MHHGWARNVNERFCEEYERYKVSTYSWYSVLYIDIQCHAESLRDSAAQGSVHVQAAANRVFRPVPLVY